MSLSFTYPGVYLSETTNVPHTVNPAATSLTAFVGDFAKGPTHQAVMVTSWVEFDTQFGGLSSSSLATYAVWQFFLNGGGMAWIVRLAGPGAATASAPLGPLTVTAASSGSWATGLTVQLSASTSVAAAGGQYADFVVRSATGQELEHLSNLPTGDLAELARLISGRSASFTAAAASTSATARAATASPPAITAGPVSVSGGADPAWDAASFATAVLAQLGMAPTAGSGPAPEGPLLDQIAPAVFNLLCIPDMVWLATTEQTSVMSAALEYCKDRRAFFLVDPPPPGAAVTGTGWQSAPGLTIDKVGTNPSQLQQLAGTGWGQSILGPSNFSGAVYYPWLIIPDPANQFRARLVPPSGTIAGIYAATDAARGVWKAPAGINAAVQGITGFADNTINDSVNGELNIAGINCLRTFPGYGSVVWGSRTLAGGDLVSSPFKYVPVRRLTDFIEQSLVQSLRWAVFEPNGPPLWSSITLEVGSFMNGLFALGAFSGTTAAQAYQVVCDATTTTLSDQLRGIVNVRLGFQPVEPVEFVVLNIALNAGTPAMGG